LLKKNQCAGRKTQKPEKRKQDAGEAFSKESSKSKRERRRCVGNEYLSVGKELNAEKKDPTKPSKKLHERKSLKKREESRKGRHQRKAKEPSRKDVKKIVLKGSTKERLKKKGKGVNNTRQGKKERTSRRMLVGASGGVFSREEVLERADRNFERGREGRGGMSKS